MDTSSSDKQEVNSKSILGDAAADQEKELKDMLMSDLMDARQQLANEMERLNNESSSETDTDNDNDDQQDNFRKTRSYSDPACFTEKANMNNGVQPFNIPCDKDFAVFRQSKRGFKKVRTVMWCRLLHPKAIMPRYASIYAAGCDIAGCHDVSIGPNETAEVDTGVAVSFPKETYGRIAARSSLVAKHNSTVLAGVIDQDYEGSIVILLKNFGSKPLFIKAGTRIAQIVLEKFTRPEIIVKETVKETAKDAMTPKRGKRKFGEYSGSF